MTQLYFQVKVVCGLCQSTAVNISVPAQSIDIVTQVENDSYYGPPRVDKSFDLFVVDKDDVEEVLRDELGWGWGYVWSPHPFCCPSCQSGSKP